MIEALERQSARYGTGGVYALDSEVVRWTRELAEAENAWLNARFAEGGPLSVSLTHG